MKVRNENVNETTLYLHFYSCMCYFQNFPLGNSDQLIYGKVQEKLGSLYIDQGDLDEAEKWYKKALRTVMDMFEMEDNSELVNEIQALKCKYSLCALGVFSFQLKLLQPSVHIWQQADSLCLPNSDSGFQV